MAERISVKLALMPLVQVRLGDRSYNIQIEPGCLKRADQLDLPAELAVFSSRSVAALYGEPLVELLRRGEKRRTLLLVQPDGEQYKSMEWVERAYDMLAEFGLTRRGALVAVGGGVVGDWTGFVAATWMRGIPVTQVPTTLLAMVDSSVGGKTGVNHPRAKNLIGAFHQPSHVLIDPECLRSLPPRELSAGLAEVVKYAIIADPELFVWLEQHVESVLQLDMPALEHIIARSCAIKAAIVGEDERESDTIGRREILNYGHTLGHALEATTAYGRLLHGEAISIGMTFAARLSRQLGLLHDDARENVLSRQALLLQRCGLPHQLPADLHLDRLWQAMLLDKKTRDGKLNFILPVKIGAVQRVEQVARADVEKALIL